MNYSSAVMLLNPNIRAIKVSYDDSQGRQQTYTFKTFDPDIEVDDLVVVPTTTRHGFTVCKVVEVDVDVDFDSNIHLKWIASKIDIRAYQNVLAEEERLIKVMQESERLAKRKEIAEKMKNLYEGVGLEKLAISHVKDPIDAKLMRPREDTETK